MTQKKHAFVIQGLAGRKTLSGDIPVRGAKNDALKAIAASFLFEDAVIVTNVPDIADVASLITLVKDLGVKTSRNDREIVLEAQKDSSTLFDTHLAKMLRSSVVLTGPVLARYGKVSFPHPGGCVIGARPIDLFISSFEKMGASCVIKDDYYHLTTTKGKLHGADIFLDFPSVGATETLMMAATLAQGTTYIRNAAIEPEIQNLAHYLVSCGAQIEGIGTSTMKIDGCEILHTRGKKYVVIPDRIETGTFVLLAALAGKNVTITHCDPTLIRSLLSLLKKAGVCFTMTEDTITVSSTDTPYRAVNVRTNPYPGFATDIQAPMTVFLTQAQGESLVFETMFEGRLNYTEDLQRMGADIVMFDPHRVMVRGAVPLTGKELEGPDLRAGLAYVIAGIVATKESIIHNVEHIDRGYEKIEERFRALGVDIQRVQE